MPTKFPRLPKVVQAAGGPVKVVLATKLRSGNRACWGLWDDAARTISLERRATMAHKWRVFYHELAHVALSDAGLDNALDEKVIETLCDAVASARWQERFG